MSVEFGKIESQAIRDQVLDAIEGALISGALRPGERVVEAKIASEAGISRGPVREAIQRLVAEGILVHIPNKGTFVAPWDDTDVAETYSLRALLESYAARLTMQRMSENDRQEMESIVERMFERARANDPDGAYELDIQFHRRLAELSGHSLLVRMLSEIGRRISMLVNLDARTTPDLIEYAQNHNMLLDALKTEDGAYVEQLFREHIVAVGDVLIRRMHEEEQRTNGKMPDDRDVSASVAELYSLAMKKRE
jgi:DNA-binding GntR family transcriptional regulator